MANPHGHILSPAPGVYPGLSFLCHPQIAPIPPLCNLASRYRLFHGAAGLVGVGASQPEATPTKVRPKVDEELSQIQVLVLAALPLARFVPQTELSHAGRIDDGPADVQREHLEMGGRVLPFVGG